MIKVAQFGEGNFLRTFADYYFDCLNEEKDEYRVDIIKPITYGTLDKFVAQNTKYHVVLRGVENGQAFDFSLEADKGLDIRREVFKRLAERDWTLLGMRSTELSLEDIFLQLTADDSGNGGNA